jgi:di/tripeptidase
MEKLDRLKEVLSIPTYFDEESRMVEYLKKVLDEKGYTYKVDKLGNIYVTKGKAKRYPCFVSHTDTVHQINENLEVIEPEEFILTGIDSETGQPSGIGGDDKCGVFLCLEMLDELEVVKVAFFVGEEYGMKGSKEACPKFFKDVKYSIQFDSPYGNTMSLTLMGKPLFNTDSEFADTVSPILIERGITEWQAHPYTDTYQLMEKFDFPCLNIAAGYYRYHTPNEYVEVGDVINAFITACLLVEDLDKDFYEVNRDSVVKDLHKINSKQNIFSS